MEPHGDSPPIWSTHSTPFVPVRRRLRLSSVLNPATLTIGFFVLILIVFFLLPPTLSRNNQVLKPNSSVKKSWNSLNIFLVLFAVLCGVFARGNDENSSSYAAETASVNAYEEVNGGRPSVSGADWLESPDRKADAKMSSYMNTGGNRLRRSSSSYPDLRQESLWGSDGEKFKFFDDFEVEFHRPPGNFHRHVRQSHEVEKDFVAETPVREIPVDKFELKNSVPPPQTSTQPVLQVPQPPPPPVKRRRSLLKQYNVERGGREAELNEKRSSVPPPSETPQPPPPPPPGLKFHPLAERREKFQGKKSGTTKELATAIVSLYQGTRGKRKRIGKSKDHFESVAHNSSPPTVLAPSSIPSVPPPPPPPPPSKNVLQNFFKKSSKSKGVHSGSTTNPPPPPPPPPPQSSIFNNIFKTGSKSKRFQLTSASSQYPPPPPPPPPSTIFNSLFKTGTKSRHLKYIENPPPPPPPLPTTPSGRPKNSPASTGKPPKPTKPSTSYHESMASAPPSPLIPMPPPPPPFTMPKLKFITKGDFVRISSANSSRCSSPGREDFDVMSVKSDGGDSIGPSFTCPSTDVDSKADTFISKCRDEWRLEKINSLWNTGSRSARLG